MSNFVIDNTSLPFPKTDLVPLQDGADPTKYVVALEWNTVCQALVDIKGALRGGTWFGLTAQASDPAPAGISTYIWLKNDGTLHYKYGIDNTLGLAGGGGSSVTIFSDSVAGANQNIITTRTNASPIDNTKAKITNLGVQDHTGEATATGATGIGSTIGGGLDNTASGNYSTVPGGLGNKATGLYSYASGWKSHATGDYSTAMGDNCTASGQDSFASGDGCQATAQSAVAMGDGCQATGSIAVAIGDGCTASGTNAVAIGDGCTARGNSSFAAGDGCLAGTNNSDFGAVAIGEGCQADLTGSFACGDSTRSSAKGASARGQTAFSSREGQDSFASGRFSGSGDAQTSMMVMRGSTPGSTSGESVELKFGRTLTGVFSPEADKGYLVTVNAIAKDPSSGVLGVRTFVQRYAVMCSHTGVTTIEEAGVQETLGTAACSSWTLVASVGTSPDRFVLTFNTGTTTRAVRCVAEVRFVEVLNS